MAVWKYDPASPSLSPPSFLPSPTLVEPQCECEVTVAGDVMDMQFLDEERIVVCLSTGSVSLLHFRPAQKVCRIVCVYIHAFTYMHALYRI